MTAAVILDTLVEASTRALVVAALVALALATFRVKVPAIRHAAWTAALVAMLLLPAVSGWMPTLPLPAWVPDVRVLGPAAVSTPATASVVASPVAARLAERSAGSVEETGATERAVTTLAADSSGPSASAQVPPAARASTWREWTVIAWLVVACILLLRELAGAWVAQRLASSGVLVDGEGQVFESPRIISPVVVGVLAPRVMVPSSWPQWGAGVREMVLLHERAHVTRRDPLVACLARVNRAVFWFHPVAWWMERHLKTVSEKACDEVVVRAVHEPRLYAAMLVEMARRLQRDGRRVAWQGIGIVDSRRFEDRVDRVLAGPSPELSRLRKATLTGLCALLVAVGVACGTPVPPLAEDPELAKSITRQYARLADYEAAQKLTLEQVAELERVVAANPDDLRATEKLITFYSQRGQKLMGWNEMLAARRPHILRMIAQHPESGLVRWPYVRRLDPDGYDQARALWLAHTERPDVSTHVLSEAATFFERSEKPLAEQLLLRAQAADPDGPTPRVAVSGVYRLPWARRLGALYAMAIVGSDGDSSYDTVTTVSTEVMRSPFAKHARQKLDESTDSDMLLGASEFLSRNAANAKVDFVPKDLGLVYAERLLKLNPASETARRILAGPAHDAEYARMVKLLGQTAPGLPLKSPASTRPDENAAFEQLSDALKLEYAHQLLWQPYGLAMRAYDQNDEPAAKAALENFKRRAEVIERLAAAAPASGATASIVADLHIAFGTYAMRQGDRREAVRRLTMATTAAATAPAQADSVTGISAGATRLTHDLLTAGERESVAAFYDAVSKNVEPWQRRVFEDAAAAIRAGRMPREYQRYLSQLR